MPRKTNRAKAGELLRQCASMRPRPDAAENNQQSSEKLPLLRCRFNEAAARCRGKHCRRRYVPPRRAVASMRPRPDAAENTGSAD